MNKLYAIGPRWNGPVKIGVAFDVQRRLKALQAGNHQRLAILWQEDHDDAFGAERYLHDLFADVREVGEWFYLASADQIEAALLTLCQKPRQDDGQDATARAASFAASALIDIAARRQGCSIEDAVSFVGERHGIDRSILWRLRYRSPNEIMTTVYSAIAVALWSELGQQQSRSAGRFFAPAPDEFQLMAVKYRETALDQQATAETSDRTD